MPSKKIASPLKSDENINQEMLHFLRLKEKEAVRAREKALEAMILLEQRNRGEPINIHESKIEDKGVIINVPKVNAKKTNREAKKIVSESLVVVGPQYKENGKLKFSPKEKKHVERLRAYKAGLIENHLKKQSADAITSGNFLNQNCPFILVDDHKINAALKCRFLR